MTAAMGRWVSGPLPREVDQALARLADTPDVKRVAVMPDVIWRTTSASAS